jgi:hypothetical protein
LHRLQARLEYGLKLRTGTVERRPRRLHLADRLGGECIERLAGAT